MLILGLVIIALAIYAIARQVDVRLVLFVAALLLGLLAGNPQAIVRKFLATFSDEKFVVPICTAMGFAYVLKHTGCDQHLVHLLVRPLVKVRFLLIPGTVLVGFLVNMPIVSQTSTAVTIGTVLIPILQAAKISLPTIGAALVLGSSIGGELLNPGAPELRTVITESHKATTRLAQKGDIDAAEAERLLQTINSERCIERLLPLNLLGLAVATGIFWAWAIRVERKTAPPPDAGASQGAVPDEFRIKLFKAAIPLLPLVLLYLTSPPFLYVRVPFDVLEDLPPGQAPIGRFESRLIGAAMLIGALVAALSAGRLALGGARAFFEGAGYGFTHIISLIVTANAFGEGIKEIGLAAALGEVIVAMPGALIPAAGALSIGFAALCGSGMATTQSFFQFFAEPALSAGIDPTHVGAVVSLASAAGRTLSPVAAVALMSAQMTGTSVFTISRRVAPPLLASTAAIVFAAMLLAPPP